MSIPRLDKARSVGPSPRLGRSVHPEQHADYVTIAVAFTSGLERLRLPGAAAVSRRCRGRARQTRDPSAGSGGVRAGLGTRVPGQTRPQRRRGRSPIAKPLRSERLRASNGGFRMTGTTVARSSCHLPRLRLGELNRPGIHRPHGFTCLLAANAPKRVGCWRCLHSHHVLTHLLPANT